MDAFIRGYIRIQSGMEAPVSATYEFLPGTGTKADFSFDFGFPGLLVFSILFLMISTATTLVREDVAHTLSRLRLANVNGATMMAGVGLAQWALAIAQVLLAFGVAVALGYGRASGVLQPYRVAALLGVSSLFAIPTIALGMIVASFSRNDADATNLGSLLLVPLVFLTGILWPMPSVSLFSIAGHTVGLYDFLPSTLAAEAIRRAVNLGEGLPSLTGPLVGLVVQSVILLALGSYLYQKRRLERG